jgi:hypothetical protein
MSFGFTSYTDVLCLPLSIPSLVDELLLLHVRRLKL